MCYLRSSTLYECIEMTMNQVTKAINEGIDAFTEKYELEEDVIKDLRALLLDSCKKHVKEVKSTPGATKAASSSRTRRKTGYNMYIKHQFDQVKNSGVTGEEADKANSQDLMSKFSREWKSLTDDEKLPYMDKAREVNEANGAETAVPKEKRAKKLSGYNYFYMQSLASIKENLQEGQKLMEVVGSSWRALSEEEQADWKKKAADHCAELASTVESE